jgi:hypothetical protein
MTGPSRRSRTCFGRCEPRLKIPARAGGKLSRPGRHGPPTRAGPCRQGADSSQPALPARPDRLPGPTARPGGDCVWSDSDRGRRAAGQFESLWNHDPCPNRGVSQHQCRTVSVTDPQARNSESPAAGPGAAARAAARQALFPAWPGTQTPRDRGINPRPGPA